MLYLLFVSSRLSLALQCNDLPAEKKKKLRRFIGISIINDIGIVSTSIQRVQCPYNVIKTSKQRRVSAESKLLIRFI